MSNNSGSTTEASGAGTERDGIPRRCWCGSGIEEFLSNTKNNPNRKFFRCSYAAARRMKHDTHAFKWMDEGIVSELEILDSRMESLESRMDSLHRELKTAKVLIVCVVVACVTIKLLA